MTSRARTFLCTPLRANNILCMSVRASGCEAARLKFFFTTHQKFKFVYPHTPPQTWIFWCSGIIARVIKIKGRFNVFVIRFFFFDGVCFKIGQVQKLTAVLPFLLPSLTVTLIYCLSFPRWYSLKYSLGNANDSFLSAPSQALRRLVNVFVSRLL